MGNMLKIYDDVLDGVAHESCGESCVYYGYTAPSGFGAIRSVTFWFNRSGYVLYRGSASIVSNGSDDSYLTSTVEDQNTLSVSRFDSRRVYPAYPINRGTGESLRCMAK